jgi:hypothetical protein
MARAILVKNRPPLPHYRLQRLRVASRTTKSNIAVVWKLHPDKSIEPVKLALGITDHAFTEVTEVLKGDLKEGEDVIIRSVVAKLQALSGIRR